MIVHSDRGGGYATLLEELCSKLGIIHQAMALYSPQSNVVAKCKNRSLTKNDECNVDNFKLTPNFWREAILPTNHIFNKKNHTKVRHLINYENVENLLTKT